MHHSGSTSPSRGDKFLEDDRGQRAESAPSPWPNTEAPSWEAECPRPSCVRDGPLTVARGWAAPALADSFALWFLRLRELSEVRVEGPGPALQPRPAGGASGQGMEGCHVSRLLLPGPLPPWLTMWLASGGPRGLEEAATSLGPGLARTGTRTWSHQPQAEFWNLAWSSWVTGTLSFTHRCEGGHRGEVLGAGAIGEVSGAPETGKALVPFLSI